MCMHMCMCMCMCMCVLSTLRFMCDTLGGFRTSEQLALLVELLAPHVHTLSNEGADLGAR